jgi:hypothetical protein
MKNATSPRPRTARTIHSQIGGPLLEDFSAADAEAEGFLETGALEVGAGCVVGGWVGGLEAVEVGTAGRDIAGVPEIRLDRPEQAPSNAAHKNTVATTPAWRAATRGGVGMRLYISRTQARPGRGGRIDTLARSIHRGISVMGGDR